MAKPCDPLEKGIWEKFKLSPDKTGSADLAGELQFTVDANGKITGNRFEPDVATGVKKERFEGLCRTISGLPEMMIFQMFVDNTLYFFSGIVTPVPGIGGTVRGHYYVALKLGSTPALAANAALLAADPGDTGGWGGSQGGA